MGFFDSLFGGKKRTNVEVVPSVRPKNAPLDRKVAIQR